MPDLKSRNFLSLLKPSLCTLLSNSLVSTIFNLPHNMVVLASEDIDRFNEKNSLPGRIVFTRAFIGLSKTIF